MRKFICYVAIFVHLSAVATEKKVEVVYLTQGYKNMVNVLSQGLTVDQIGAHLTMQTMDIRLFQDLHGFAIERKIDPTTAKIKIRAEKDKIFIEGLRHPIQVANSPELKLSYLDQEIPYASGRSLGENLKIIETFFKRQPKTSMRWNGLLFGEQVAQAQMDDISIVPHKEMATLATGIALSWSDPPPPDQLFGYFSLLQDLEIGCAEEVFFLKGKGQQYKFQMQDLSETKDKRIKAESNKAILVSYEKLGSEAPGYIVQAEYRFGLKQKKWEEVLDDPAKSRSPGRTEVPKEIVKVLEAMAAKMATGKKRNFLCPADDKTLAAWNLLAKAIKFGKTTSKDAIPRLLQKTKPPPAAK